MPRTPISWHDRKHGGLPFREPLPPEISYPLSEAADVLGKAPGSACAMCRQAIQRAALFNLEPEELRLDTKGNTVWSDALARLAIKIGGRTEWADLVYQSIRFGNWASHDLARKKVTPSMADQAWYSTLYLLERLGYATEEYGGPVLWHRVAKRYGILTEHWRGPFVFSETTHSEVWHRGGLIDVRFGCPECGHLTTIEDVLVSSPNTAVDQSSESWTYASTQGECSECETSLEIVTTNTLGWWDVDLPAWKYSYEGAGNSWSKCPENSALSPGEYLFQIMLDFEVAEEDNET